MAVSMHNHAMASVATARPAPERPHRPAYSDDEIALVHRLRAQGQTWQAIADRMPGRTVTGLIAKFGRTVASEASWPAERKVAARRRYEAGERPADIARALGGVSGQQVAALARREGWTVRTKAHAALPVASVSGATTAVAPPAPAYDARTDPSPYAPLPVIRSLPPLPGKGRCEWPEGDTDRPGFRYCGAEVETGRCYCAAHAAIAFRLVTPAAAAREADWTASRLPRFPALPGDGEAV